ncbi:TetR/AcrR family transcriptional regulator [Algivirga pacifica]|uniref:TetR/AcrR family transcriptional regulator n=2 Tax=Algivirga pacifica TaxID=1162670 RepID=A0ABP9DD53_9BACT
MTKKEKILDTMLQLIAERGVHDTPMSLISKVSGVATGTIYHHFSSKEKILVELYLGLKAELGRITQNALTQDIGFKEKLNTFWVDLFQYYIKHPLKFQFGEQIINTPIIDEETTLKGKEFYQPAIDFLAEGIRSQQIRTINLRLLSEMIYSNIGTLVKIHINDKDLQSVDHDMVQEAFDIIWKGIKA